MEPPELVKKQWELYDQLTLTGDPVQQKALMEEILELSADIFYAIGVTTEPNGYGIVNKRLRNVPDSIPLSWIYPTPAPANPQTFFFE